MCPLTGTISSLQRVPGLGVCLSLHYCSPGPLPAPAAAGAFGGRRCGLCRVNDCSGEVEMVPKSAGCWLQTVPTCAWCTSLPPCPFRGTSSSAASEALSQG